MATVPNDYYAIQGLKEGMQNLSQGLGQLFAPDPTKAYAAAQAAATAQKTQQLADFFRYASDPNNAKDPNFRQRLDALGVGTGSFSPNQSYYSVDQNNATSRANNAADNARALSTNAADNANRVLTTAMQPVSKDQTRFLPPEVAKSLGVNPTQLGIVEIDPNKITAVPNAQGTPVPVGSEGSPVQAPTVRPFTEQEAAQFGGKGYMVNGMPHFPPSPQVQINNAAESEIEKGYGSGIGAQLKDVTDRAAQAPHTLANVQIMRDALARGGDDLTTGPQGDAVLKFKQFMSGLTGEEVPGTSPAEIMNNIGIQLATAAAKNVSSRPTQAEFLRILATKPGILMSKAGSQAVLNMYEQNAKDDVALGQLASDPRNRANWLATVQNYYKENPIPSPFDPSRPLGAQDIQALEATGRKDITPVMPVLPQGGRPILGPTPGAPVMPLPNGKAPRLVFDPKTNTIVPAQ